VLDDAMAGN